MKKQLILSSLCICLFMLSLGCPSDPGVTNITTLGNYGAMRLYTSNSGGNWSSLYNMTFQSEQINYEIYSIQRVSCFDGDLRHLTIIGGNNSHIYNTTNYGGKWEPNYFSGSGFQAMSKTSLDGVGFLTGFHEQWKTQDNGFSWTASANPYNWPDYYIGIDFCSENNGICIPEYPGDTTIYTTDGGTLWQQGSMITNSQYMSDIRFISSFPGTEAVVCGNSGSIYRTTDLGVSWQQIVSPVNDKDFNRVDFIDPVGIIVGNSGAIVRTTDRGLSWTIINSGVTNNLRSVYLEASNYWIVGDNVILRSGDQGRTWTVVRNASDEFYTDMVFVKNEGVVVGNKNR
ncbi:MAG: YCF48-related protein [Ignavibacteria bacterium]